MEKFVAITGCNGYIGGQTVLQYKDLGYKVIGVDRNTTSPWIRSMVDYFVSGDIVSPLFIRLIKQYNPDAFIHIAGTSLVGPSVTDPAPYYENNVGNTAKLLGSLSKEGWKGTVVFSGSAAIYGNPPPGPLLENSPKVPISPYGQSKLMAEQVLRDCGSAYGLNTVSLRYFNACGADNQTRHGQLKQATHLIARVMESIVNKSVFTLNGTDYDTPDGTCVRDYLHVSDIANAHYLATLYSESNPGSTEFNLGTGKGTSINQIIESVERITGKKVLVHKGPRREGDPATLIAMPTKAKRDLGWDPISSDIDNIVNTAWLWYNSTEYKNRA